MRQTLVNGRWPLILPDHRADFHEVKPWWEAARLADMWWELDGTLGKQRTWRPDLPQNILDVGSEEGDLTALYASWGAEVAFIDPSKPWIYQTMDILRANGLPLGPSFMGLADNYNALELPAVDETRFVTMDEDVRRIRLDTFVSQSGFMPDAVTIDVEGSELRVLEGAGNLLTENIVWWVSIHGDVDPHNVLKPSAVHAFMRERGFKDQWLGHQHEWFYRFWRA